MEIASNPFQNDKKAFYEKRWYLTNLSGIGSKERVVRGTIWMSHLAQGQYIIIYFAVFGCAPKNIGEKRIRSKNELHHLRI